MGYGRIRDYLFDALEAAGGVEWMEETEFGWDYRLFFGWPAAWMVGQDKPIVRDALIHTMYELQIPPSWVDVMNRFRLIWTPSQWCADTFREAGVERPIVVAGYGVDDGDFPYRDRAETRRDRPFTFLAIGHMLHGRKGAFQVMSCFLELKQQGELGDSLLIIKTQKGPLKHVKAPGIIHIHETLEQKDFVRMMLYSDVLFYPQTGEGFGLIPLEFMCTGGAAAVTAYSGCVEYLRPEYNIILPHPCSREELKERMVWAYEHQDAVREMGNLAARYVRRDWTWVQAGLKARQGLYEQLGR